MMRVAAAARRGFRVRGVVQGVGFRPFVHRLAGDLGLSGHVGNDADGVFIEVEGAGGALAEFEARLRSEAPPLARVDGVESVELVPVAERGFRIVASRAGAGVTFVAPDVAVCDDCLRDLFDPVDRRYRYPFVTCTNCGPRFTITMRLPYDRANTTMASFALCDACAREFGDPGDRRFHAQPLACAACGPTVWFEPARGGRDSEPGDPVAVRGVDAALAAAQVALAAGAIVAVKGLGGYHLACAADHDAAVRRLRDRKGRIAKPFAVMVADLEVARRLGRLDGAEADALRSPPRPIVLLERRPGAPISEFVAPGNPRVGVMLPYTPLHHLLFRPVPGTAVPVPEMLVMTSGNLSDEPIAYDDADAHERLRGIADAWLVHDRPIHVPCDDSVVRVVDGEELPIRRSRGYAPLPLVLPIEAPPVLAVGGELKNAFCLASGPHAWMSQHIGDMGSVETLAAFERSTTQFRTMYEVDPRTVAADEHPGYHTRQWAEAASASVALVQHHHAHVAALMAEHSVGAGERLLGFAFDGTGSGPDGAIWGGEALLARDESCERVAHLRYVPLPGGDAAIRHPSRVSLAHLRAAGIDWTLDLPPVQATPVAELRVLEHQLTQSIRCVPTSSMGRLFDAVSSLLGICHAASYEAEAAIELEACAARAAGDPRDYGFECVGDEIDPAPVLRAIVDDLRRGTDPEPIAAGFHAAVAGAIVDVANTERARSGVNRVGLTGGVFQNAVLLQLARAGLARAGFDVLIHRLVPPNDGGIALGQALVVAYRSRGRVSA